MLDALSTINSWIVEGPIHQDCYDFRVKLMDNLRADGWEVKINARDNYAVKPGKEYWQSLRSDGGTLK